MIQYLTIATTGNTTDFGDLINRFVSTAACSSTTRGVFFMGYSTSNWDNTINYITMATTSNATDFGDLTLSSYGGMYAAASSNGTRGIIEGGSSTQIVQITIATTGNPTNFGTMISSQNLYAGACSGN